MSPNVREQLQQALGEAYAIESELAPGGMSRLFVALDVALDRKVVIKLLAPELASEVSVARFQREIALTAHLQHPHVLPILSAGAREGLLFYIAPFVEGESLRHRLVREGPLPIHDAVRIVSEMADALSYAHVRGVIHRDVKPENILLQGDHALLADFGIARALSDATDGRRLTGTGMGIGTLHYMAPEQLFSDEVSASERSDIYALGVVAYESLTGFTPRALGSPQHGAPSLSPHAIKPVEQLRAGVPTSVSRAIARALAFAPQERFESADAMRRAFVQNDAPTRQHFAPVAAGVSVILGIAIAAVIASSTRGFEKKNPPPTTPPALVERTAPSQMNAVAVLPFADLSREKGNEYFSDGMAEDLITALSKVRGLRVAARTASFAFKGNSSPLAEVAHQLHVDFIVEGSVRRIDRRLRVSARLVDIRSGFDLWSDNYDRKLEDIFSVQDDIAHAISREVEKRIERDPSTASTSASGVSSVDESKPLVVPPTRNLEAYDLFLRARALLEQRGEGALRGAISLLSIAVGKDSTFAAAYATLALAYDVLPSYAHISEDSVAPLVRTNALHALALDSSSAVAESVLGDLASSQWQWSDAERHMRRAIALEPTSAAAHLSYAVLLRGEGRFGDAVAEHTLVLSFDSLSAPAEWNLGITLWHARHFAAATDAAKRAIQLAPTHMTGYMVLSAALAGVGSLDSAARVMDLIRRRFPTSVRLEIAAWVYGRANRPRDGQEMVRLMRMERLGVEVTAQEMAVAHLGLGQTDSALFWISESIRRKESGWSGNYPMCSFVFDSLRIQPRYRAAVVNLRLPRCDDYFQPSTSSAAPR